MTAEDRLKKRVRPEVESAIAALDSPSANVAAALASLSRANDLLAAGRARIPKPAAPGRTKADRKTERNTRAAEIRAAVMERADGKCEFCHREGFVLEWAHIFGGGERRYREDVTNTAANCWDCHRGWERAKPDTFRAAKEWAIRLGFKDALREIEHRMAKAEEARR